MDAEEYFQKVNMCLKKIVVDTAGFEKGDLANLTIEEMLVLDSYILVEEVLRLDNCFLVGEVLVLESASWWWRCSC